MADGLERARMAYARHAWAEAYDLLAVEAAQGPVALEDSERLAVAAYLVGKDAESALAWERAHRECQRLDDPELAARCAFWLAFGLLLRGELAQAGGWLARAARLVEGRDDSVARGLLLVPTAIGALEEGDTAAAAALAIEALEIGRRTDDKDLLAFAMLLRGEAALAQGDTVRGLTALDEVMVAVTTGEVSPIPAGIVYCAVIEACMAVFDLRRAAEWTGALSDWCDAQPDLVPYRGQCLVHRSQILQAHGEWPDAASEAARACERLSQPAHPALGMAMYQQGEMHRLRGEFEQAERAYRQANGNGREPIPGLALLRLAEGKVDGAAAAIRRAATEARGLGRPGVLAAAVEILIAAGDATGARVASEELTKIAADVGAPVLVAMAAHATGAVLLAEGAASDALAALRPASTGWRRLDMPYEEARSRVLVALARRATGDHDGADLELDAARTAFERLGAQPDLARVAAVVRPALASDLTERECEVLRLVAQGKTNREIGSVLVISEHTVARHLQNVFTKLELSSRTAATAYAYENGIV
jgi:ATP/maltotriose-dependent transcriptional regulator MalT